MKWIYGAAIVATLAALYVAADKAYPASRFDEKTKNMEKITFPNITASNLEGKTYNLPADFDGEKNLCLIAFTQQQQLDVNTWLDGMKTFPATPGLEVYELPTVYEGTPMFRKFLDNAMIQGIPDKKQRERTITLYLNKPAFRKRLALPTESTIYALLVARDGTVLWRTEGRYTKEKTEALRQAVK